MKKLTPLILAVAFAAGKLTAQNEAELFTPFNLTTPGKITVQHNGAELNLQDLTALDNALQKVATGPRWNLSEAQESTVLSNIQVVYFPTSIISLRCKGQPNGCLAENRDLLGYTLLLPFSNDGPDQATLEDNFDKLFTDLFVSLPPPGKGFLFSSPAGFKLQPNEIELTNNQIQELDKVFLFQQDRFPERKIWPANIRVVVGKMTVQTPDCKKQARWSLITSGVPGESAVVFLSEGLLEEPLDKLPFLLQEVFLQLFEGKLDLVNWGGQGCLE